MKKRIRIAIIILCISTLAMCSYVIIGRIAAEKIQAKEFNDLAALTGNDVPNLTANDEMVSVADQYSELYKLNSDFIGWIRIEGTTINYPVMQTVDRPDYYLRRNFYKEYSVYGVPYLAEGCDLAASNNLIIYGHSVVNGIMFGPLLYYVDRSYWEQHPKVLFDTMTGEGEYRIIAVFVTSVYNKDGDPFPYYDYTSLSDKEQFDRYVTEAKAIELYDTGATAEFGDKLITLSTCEYSRDNGRMVVVAKKILLP
jgi:sortase B